MELLAQNGYRTAIFYQHSGFNDKSRILSDFDESFSIGRPAAVDLGTLYEERRNASEIAKWMESKGEKQFLYWHILYPHNSHVSGIEVKSFFEGIRLDSASVAQCTVHPDLHMGDPNVRNYINALYDSSLRYADTMVGLLYDELTRRNLLKGTLVIITADHGENLCEHGPITWGPAGIPC